MTVATNPQRLWPWTVREFGQTYPFSFSFFFKYNYLLLFIINLIFSCLSDYFDAPFSPSFVGYLAGFLSSRWYVTCPQSFHFKKPQKLLEIIYRLRLNTCLKIFNYPINQV